MKFNMIYFLITIFLSCLLLSCCNNDDDKSSGREIPSENNNDDNQNINSPDDDNNMSDKDDNSDSDKDNNNNKTKDKPLSITSCQMILNHTVNVLTNDKTEPIISQVSLEGCTQNIEQCANLKGYIGYGKRDDSIENYHFVEIQPDTDFSGEDNSVKQFVGTITAPNEPGEYKLVSAFSLDDGTTKVYCDTTIFQNFDISKAGTFNVTKELGLEDLKISWCQIYWPRNDIEMFDTDSVDIFGRVYVEGCTNKKEGCIYLTGYLGYGPIDETDPSKFTYVEAVHNPDPVNISDNEEFQSTLQSIDAGEYNIAYRFSLDGENWMYCDRDNIKGYDANSTLRLYISASQR